MGLCGSKTDVQNGEKDERAHTKQIDQQNEQDFHKELEKVKLLLLGAGESGKSTIFKQMKIIYGRGFQDADKLNYRSFIYANIMETIKAVCEASEVLGTKAMIEAVEAYDKVKSCPAGDKIDEEIGQAIATLWADPGIQETWKRRSEFQVVETTKSYFDRIESIIKPNYMPTSDDILLARVRTTGVIEENYEIEGTYFVMYDVGGQRSERKKWVHHFENVHAVIYVCALSEYDMVLFEDNVTNRMVESLRLFEDVCNNKVFLSTSMILFLNKSDLFRIKINVKSISDIEHFNDYTGEAYSYDDGVNYFINLFLARNKSTSKDIFVNVTCATDSNNVHTVFNSCKQIILKQNLQANGFT